MTGDFNFGHEVKMNGGGGGGGSERQNSKDNHEGDREIYSVKNGDGDCCFPKVSVTSEDKIAINMKIDGTDHRLVFPQAIDPGVEYNLHVMMCKNSNNTNGDPELPEGLFMGGLQKLTEECLKSKETKLDFGDHPQIIDRDDSVLGNKTENRRSHYDESRFRAFQEKFARNNKAAEVGPEKCWMTTDGVDVEKFETYEDVTFYAAAATDRSKVATDFEISMPHYTSGAPPMPAGGQNTSSACDEPVQDRLKGIDPDVQIGYSINIQCENGCIKFTKVSQ